MPLSCSEITVKYSLSWLIVSLCTQLWCHLNWSCLNWVYTNKQKNPLSLFQSGSTMGIQISLATGSSTLKQGLKVECCHMSSWTGWRGSSLSRTWRSGWSMRSEFRPSTVLAQDLGASRSMAGPGSLVRKEVYAYTCQYVLSYTSGLCILNSGLYLLL